MSNDAVALGGLLLLLALVGMAGVGLSVSVDWLVDRWVHRAAERRRRAWMMTPEAQALRMEMRVARIRFVRALIRAGRA